MLMNLANRCIELHCKYQLYAVQYASRNWWISSVGADCTVLCWTYHEALWHNNLDVGGCEFFQLCTGWFVWGGVPVQNSDFLFTCFAFFNARKGSTFPMTVTLRLYWSHITALTPFTSRSNSLTFCSHLVQQMGTINSKTGTTFPWAISCWWPVSSL